MSVLDAAIGQLDANERWLSKHCKGLGRACASASFASVPWIQVDQVKQISRPCSFQNRPSIPPLVLYPEMSFLGTFEKWKHLSAKRWRRSRFLTQIFDWGLGFRVERWRQSRFLTQILTQFHPLAEHRVFFEAHNGFPCKARSIAGKNQVVQGKACVVQKDTGGGACVEGKHKGGKGAPEVRFDRSAVENLALIRAQVASQTVTADDLRVWWERRREESRPKGGTRPKFSRLC